MNISFEDIFKESAWLIDTLMSESKVTQELVDMLWSQIINNLRQQNPSVAETDKMLMAGTVFAIAQEAFCHSTKSSLSMYIYEMLGVTLEKYYKACDNVEENDFQNNLLKSTSLLSDWMIAYENAEHWLSDEIEATLTGKTVNQQEEDGDWVDALDSVFDERIKAVKVYKALCDITYPSLSINSFFFVAFIVLLEIKWIKNCRGKQKHFLEWINYHYKNCQFKRGIVFVDIESCLKNTPSKLWNQNMMKSNRIMSYIELANILYDTFTENYNGKIIDRGNFIKGSNRINTGH